jgi:ribosomal protein S18 acetylase RimI-like enzyme
MHYTLPEHFSIRRPSLDDVKALFALLNICELAEFGNIRTSETELRNLWELPGHDLTQDAWLVIAPGEQIVAFAFVVHLAPVSRLFDDINVHPAYADQGLYDYLLELTLERARQLVSTAEAHVRVSVGVTCAEKNAVLHAAAERAGFKHVRSNWLMQIDMDAPPPTPVWPAEIELRPYTPELLRAIYDADNDAFQDHWGHVPFVFEVWQHWTVKREDFDPSLWFLAFAGEEIAGFALCAYENGEAWVGELGVRRPWRQKGLGLAFLYQAFGEFYRRGVRKVVLNVDSQNLTGATRLYIRAGMRAVQQGDIYELELRPGLELSTQTLEK